MIAKVLFIFSLAYSINASPVLDYGYASHGAPIQTIAHAAPIQTYTHAAPIQTYAHAAPIQTYAHAAPIQTIAHAAPIYQQAPIYSAPIIQKTYAQPQLIKQVIAQPQLIKQVIAQPQLIKQVIAEPIDPNPQYSFSYGVSDPHTGDNKHAEETLLNGVTHGSYSLSEPDGSIRKVTYTADKINGFNAVVEKLGGQKIVAAAPAPVLTKVISAPSYAPAYHASYAAPAIHAAPAYQTTYAAPAIHAAPAYQTTYAAPAIHAAPAYQTTYAAPAIHAAPAYHASFASPYASYHHH